MVESRTVGDYLALKICGEITKIRLLTFKGRRLSEANLISRRKLYGHEKILIFQVFKEVLDCRAVNELSFLGSYLELW